MKRANASTGWTGGLQSNGGRSLRRLQTWRAIILCFSCIILTATKLPIASADLNNESAILLSIKKAWGNPEELVSWSSQFSPCLWNFVTCNAKNTTVTELLLPTSTTGNKGPLPASIGDLVNLQSLTIDFWGLNGTIPSTIGLLSNLQSLDLGENDISGSIPPEIGNLTNLQSLWLNSNNLTGSLPDSLSKLQNLQYLTVGSNQLTRPFPTWIGDLPLLQSLHMENNFFTGTIPPSLGNLTNLQIIDLTSAFASAAGPLPPELGKLTSIINMVLKQNTFNGAIPETFGDLATVQTLDLTQCNIDGSIPSILGNLLNLTHLNLGLNSIIGPIPDELGNASALVHLELYQNQLSKSIPTQFGQLSNLTYLDLHSNYLTGPIPPQLDQLEQLTYIDLSSNALAGQIPPQLAALPVLQTLDLQGNCLSGPIPKYNTSELTSVNFGLAGNANCFNSSQVCKCAAPAPAPQSESPPFAIAGGVSSSGLGTTRKVYIAVGVVVGSLLGLVFILLILFVRHKREPKSVNPSSNYRGPVKQYTVAQVSEATENFTTKVGEGAFSTVYKAVFPDGCTAAVKRFNKRKPSESFEQEVEILSSLNHRFLVNLIGYCEDIAAGEHILVYEFMDRGNLNENLHGDCAPLTWDERVRVIISVGYGIDYLHYGTDPPMIHRDIKSANILLSSRGNALIAKLADFGLGRQTVVDEDLLTATFGNEPPKAFPTKIAGTPGYFDPEYLYTSIVTPKTDVYSYGVVMLELITGKTPVLEERQTLAAWAKPYLVSEDIWSVLDPKLEKGTFNEEQVRAVAELALSCTEHDARKRPTIKEVCTVLSELFSVESRMVNSSLASRPRTTSSVEFSDYSSLEDSQSRDSQRRVFNGEHSTNLTQSEILPRD